MTKFGTHMRIDLGMVPTKYWPREWPGSVGSLGPISESGLSCQLLLRAVVWQMTSQLIRRRNDVVFAAFNQPVSVRPMNVQKINKTNVYPPHPGGSSVPGGGSTFQKCGKFHELPRKSINKKNSAEKITKTCSLPVSLPLPLSSLSPLSYSSLPSTLPPSDYPASLRITAFPRYFLNLEA